MERPLPSATVALTRVRWLQARRAERGAAAAHQSHADEVAPDSGSQLTQEVRGRGRAPQGGDGPLTRVLAPQLASAQPEKVFVRNKAAQVFALTFVMEYLTLWPKFFFDVLLLVGLNPNGVDVYLRTLMAIDAEVVDRDVLHSPEVRRVNLEPGPAGRAGAGLPGSGEEPKTVPAA